MGVKAKKIAKNCEKKWAEKQRKQRKTVRKKWAEKLRKTSQNLF